ncbi:MAG: hypothetical protein GY874_13070 [Desulfobacteraceae bacterium]|nr:hypothetical protein [Desulfobacteraceae bacterium]
MLVFGLAVQSWAESATKDEVVAKCNEAVESIKTKGIDASIKAIGDKKGPFVWKDTYVFLMDMEGKMLAHPMKPELTEKGSLVGIKDKDGKAFFAEFVKIAGDKGKGWVDYKWPKPGQKDPSPKSSYIVRVPDTPYVVGAGIYQ